MDLSASCAAAESALGSKVWGDGGVGVSYPGSECTDASGWLCLLFMLHLLPEGMTIGVRFVRNDLSVGLPTTLVIALQDVAGRIGCCALVVLVRFGVACSVPIGGASGLVESVSTLLGIGLSRGFALAGPMGMGLSAGAPIFVISQEVIPETHRNRFRQRLHWD